MANIDQVQLPDGSQYHIIDDTSGYATTTYVQDQISTINKNTIGLGNVDNTADINKPVSLPQQTALDGKVDDDIVAYVESDTTATKRHEVGDQFILNGVLYTATAIIAVNDTIVIGTNASLADSITTQIGNANSAISTLNTAVGTKANKADLTNLDLTGTTNTTGSTISSGTFFYLNGVLVRAKTAIASGATFTLNTNYEVVTVGGLNELASAIYAKNAPASNTVIVNLPNSAQYGYFYFFLPTSARKVGKTVTITNANIVGNSTNLAQNITAEPYAPTEVGAIYKVEASAVPSGAGGNAMLVTFTVS